MNYYSRADIPPHLLEYFEPTEIGLEFTPDAYLAELGDVFREVRRVLRDDGTLWLNLGDSYNNFRSSMGPGQALHGRDKLNGKPAPASKARGVPGLKEKDMIGIPWRVAFALQADGWYLRSEIIWAKGNPMPEAVTDRPTKAHEYIFLLTKSPSYFYDHEAVKEEALCDRKRGPALHPDLKSTNGNAGLSRRELEPTRNRRSSWHINTKPYKGAHFATFPEELPEVCIRAGTSEKGACPACGAPWKRVMGRVGEREANGVAPENHSGGTRAKAPTGSGGGNVLASVPKQHLGWEPTCGCPEHDPVPCIVLDPFAGSGTTLAVAKYLRRDYLGCELNPEYHKIIDERLRPAEEHEAERQGFDEMLSLPED